jgi:TonB family protein
MSLIQPFARSRAALLLASGGALLLAALLFLLIPATQMLPDEMDEILSLREMDISSIPPISNNPPPPELEEEEVQLDVDLLVPEILFEQATNASSVQEPVLQALPLSYSPGGGDTVLMGAPLAEIQTGVSVSGAGLDFSKIFSFSDLRETPRILHIPAVRYPDSLIRRGVKRGEVVLLIEIDPEGKARVEKVISCSHPELESLAVDTVHRSRFTIPRIEGKAVRVKGRWPLVFNAPN